MAKKKKATMDYCLDDYNNRHFWKSIGIFHIDNSGEYEVFRCTQCGKCKSIKIIYVENGSWYQL